MKKKVKCWNCSHIFFEDYPILFVQEEVKCPKCFKWMNPEKP